MALGGALYEDSSCSGLKQIVTRVIRLLDPVLNQWDAAQQKFRIRVLYWSVLPVGDLVFFFRSVLSNGKSVSVIMRSR